MSFDLEEIKERFREVVRYSQGIEEPMIDELFDTWLLNKKDIIESWNGNLIYRYPYKVSFGIEDDTKEDRINQLIDEIEIRYQNNTLACFIEDNRDDFYGNKMTASWDNYGIYVPEGAKIIKSFKRFEENKRKLEEMQTAASRVIQADKIEGYIYFSVHPLDFLSLSENAHNWCSCHALDHDYRAGNLSYMCDKSSFICYISDGLDYVIPNFPFPWNSKKWRTLMFLSDDWNMMFAGRSYPFKNMKALDFIRETMMEESGLTLGSKWSNWDNKSIKDLYSHMSGARYSLRATYYPVGYSLINQFDLIKDPKYALHYNDLLYSNIYDPVYSFRERNPHKHFHSPFGSSNEKQTVFHIGNKVKCLCCGEHHLTESNMMWCISCEEKYGDTVNDDFGYCACCGRHIHDKHAMIIENGDLICHQCANTETYECECCGRIFYKEDLIYNDETSQYLCGYCIEEDGGKLYGSEGNYC